MERKFTHDANLRNKKFTHWGMENSCAARNRVLMKRIGLIQARKRLKLTQEKMAERLGISIAQVSRWETGDDGIPSHRVSSICEAYGVTIAEIFNADEAVPEASPPESNARVVHFEGASNERMHQDVPILGTALGSDRMVDDLAVEQTYLYSDDVIGRAKRPVVLDGRADVYGIYVQGSSMDPAFEDGQLIFVEGRRQPRVGEYVLVYLRRNGGDQEGDDGESARTVLVKRLTKRSASFLELEQFNPRAKFTVTTADVLKYHRVIPYTELLS
ncbi:XRE family transcriptional regulator [Novosphingobium sp.]|uniref:XRE family transcriptional regulator n=1 Tax=Novosphingobium sp. TaxID=1874826 RepID=UPI002FDDC9F8